MSRRDRGIRWRARVRPEPDRPYVVSIGLFVLDGARHLPRFLWHSLRVARLAARTDGMVGFRLRARFSKLHFLEISAFEDREAMRRFVAAPSHRTAIRANQPHLDRGSKLVSTEVYGRDLPPRWSQIDTWLEESPGLGEAGGPPRKTVVGAAPPNPA